MNMCVICVDCQWPMTEKRIVNTKLANVTTHSDFDALITKYKTNTIWIYFSKSLWYLPKTSLIFYLIEKMSTLFSLRLSIVENPNKWFNCAKVRKNHQNKISRCFFDHIIIWSIFNFLSGNTGSGVVLAIHQLFWQIWRLWCHLQLVFGLP